MESNGGIKIEKANERRERARVRREDLIKNVWDLSCIKLIIIIWSSYISIIHTHVFSWAFDAVNGKTTPTTENVYTIKRQILLGVFMEWSIIGEIFIGWMTTSNANA